MVIDHIGILVRSLVEGIEHWKNLFGYVQSSEIVANGRQKVNVVFLTKPDSVTVKLFEPAEPSSPVYALAMKGGGLHHLCFRCDSLHTKLVELERKGARLLVAPEPGEAFNDHEVAFLFAPFSNLNFELIDTDKKTGLDPSDIRCPYVRERARP